MGQSLVNVGRRECRNQLVESYQLDDLHLGEGVACLVNEVGQVVGQVRQTHLVVVELRGDLPAHPPNECVESFRVKTVLVLVVVHEY